MKSKPFFFIAGFCFLIAFFLTCLDLNSFNRSFYTSEYKKLDVAQTIGITSDELQLTTETLLDYIQDERADLDVSAVVQGKLRDVFNEKEKLHMIDVKVLYMNAMAAKNILWVIVSASFFIGYLLNKKEAIALASEMFLKSMVCILSVVLFLGLFALVDFNQFWLQFHYLFFTNELFLLDPSTDILIQMVPSQFFFDLVFRIAGSYIIGIAVLGAISWKVRKKANDSCRTL